MAQIAVTRVTHSCHLIEIGGRTFLSDPWFSTKPGYYQGERTRSASPICRTWTAFSSATPTTITATSTLSLLSATKAFQSPTATRTR
jgi:L-ascorbate metabolism protein UlaG (beta-lactamase superfamily)